MVPRPDAADRSPYTGESQLVQAQGEQVDILELARPRERLPRLKAVDGSIGAAQGERGTAPGQSPV